MNELMTLACGGMPRVADTYTNLGNVVYEPDVKLVTMKSSKLRLNASSAAAAMPGMQQRERDAPERLPRRRVQVGGGLLERGSRLATRALTVTTTKLMQNSTCAATTVPKPSGTRSGEELREQRGAEHDLGRGHRQEDQQVRRRAAPEPEPDQRDRDQRAERGRDQRRDDADLEGVGERLAHLRRPAGVLPVLQREARHTRLVLPASLNENTTV